LCLACVDRRHRHTVLAAKVSVRHIQTVDTVSDINSPAGDVTEHPSTDAVRRNGDQLRRVQLLADMKPWNAVQSPAGTFIVSTYNAPMDHEINTTCQVLRQFSSSLGRTPHVAVDSHGNIFVADFDSCRILLLSKHLPRPASRHHRRTSSEQRASTASLLRRTFWTTAGCVLPRCCSV